MAAKEQCQHVSEQTVAEGKWLSLKNVTYKSEKGVNRTWEAVSRTTTVTSAAGRLDAVAVLPIYQRTLHKDCLVCVKQYRPAMKAYTLELPAGLVDAGEDPATAAMRELLEETGYTGIVKHISPATALDPGVEDCTLVIVTAEVDGDDVINEHPQQRLGSDESSVKVVMISLSDVIQTLNDYSSKGVVVDSRLYTYAIAHTQTTKVKKLERLIKLEQC